MIILAYCEDSADGRERRETALGPHMAHLRGVIDRIGLAAPLATADGAAMSGDDRLVASLFAIRTDDPQVAKAVMAADPYFIDGVWRRIDFYRTGPLSGIWIDRAAPSAASRPPRRLYAAFLLGDLGPPPAAEAPAVMLAGSLDHAISIGDGPPARPFGALRVLQAEDIEAARALTGASVRGRSDPPAALVFAVPVASGALVGLTQI